MGIFPQTSGIKLQSFRNVSAQNLDGATCNLTNLLAGPNFSASVGIYDTVLGPTYNQKKLRVNFPLPEGIVDIGVIANGGVNLPTSYYKTRILIPSGSAFNMREVGVHYNNQPISGKSDNRIPVIVPAGGIAYFELTVDGSGSGQFNWFGLTVNGIPITNEAFIQCTLDDDTNLSVFKPGDKVTCVGETATVLTVDQATNSLWLIDQSAGWKTDGSFNGQSIYGPEQPSADAPPNPRNLQMQGSTFTTVDGELTGHVSSTWQIAPIASTDYSTITEETVNDTTNLTSWQPTQLESQTQ